MKALAAVPVMVVPLIVKMLEPALVMVTVCAGEAYTNLGSSENDGHGIYINIRI